MAKPKPPFSPVPQLSAAVAAVEQIEGLIRSGRLRPGDRLPPERNLAELLGVSRPTVREALRALAILNVVDARQGSGTYIGSLEPRSLAAPLNLLMSVTIPCQDVISVLETRAVLESGLARLAAERISDDALAQFERRLAQLQQAQSGSDILRHDLALHDLIARESGNEILQWILDSARELFAVVRTRTIQVAGVREHVAEDQAHILAALRRRDPEAASQAMWKHLTRIEEYYINEKQKERRFQDFDLRREKVE